MTLPEDWLQQIREHYPKRIGGYGWGYVKKRIPELVQSGESFDDLLDGVKRYSALMKATKTERTPYVLQARTFFGPGEWWLEDYDLPNDGSVDLTLDQQAAQYGIIRQDKEGDDSLRKRLGIAMTNQRYAK